MSVKLDLCILTSLSYYIVFENSRLLLQGMLWDYKILSLMDKKCGMASITSINKFVVHTRLFVNSTMLG